MLVAQKLERINNLTQANGGGLHPHNAEVFAKHAREISQISNNISNVIPVILPPAQQARTVFASGNAVSFNSNAKKDMGIALN